MDRETAIALTLLFLIAAIVAMLIPVSNNMTGAAIVVEPFNKDDFCDQALNDLVRLNKVRAQAPEIQANYDFQKRLKTAQLQVQACS